jgi:hypothetical protein
MPLKRPHAAATLRCSNTRDGGTVGELLRLLSCERGHAGVSRIRANVTRGLGGYEHVAWSTKTVAQPRQTRHPLSPSRDPGEPLAGDRRLCKQGKQQPTRTPSGCRSPAQTSRHPAFGPVAQSAGVGQLRHESAPLRRGCSVAEPLARRRAPGR